MRLFVSLTLIAISFAGCLGGNNSPATFQETGHVETARGNLTAILDVDIINGTAPLHVAIDLDGAYFHHTTQENVTESANDTAAPAEALGNVSLAWTVTSALANQTTELANGTTLPATLTHVFGVGNHDLAFSLTVDNATATASQTIAVWEPSHEIIEDVSDLVQVVKFAGTFEEGAEEALDLTVNVPAGTHAITGWVSWDGGIPLLPSSAYPNDIDVFLKKPSGGTATSAETLSYEYIRYQQEGALDAGEWTLTLLPYDIPRASAWEGKILLWMAPPMEQSIEGSKAGGHDAGRDLDPILHTIDMPAVHAAEVYLEWRSAVIGELCEPRATRANDLDLSVAADGKEILSSGYFHSCEYDSLDSSAGDIGVPAGPWEITVAPYYATSAEYIVHVLYL